MSDEILFQIQGGIATLRFNRPQARNALNWRAQEQFAARVEDVARDKALRVLILTGTGGAFVSGGDLKELSRGDLSANGQRLSRVMSGALAQMMRLPLPIIAAVNGPAVGGGCEILLACDLRVAAGAARLSFAQARLGLTTGWGGAARLVALVGRSRAADILLRARTLTARQALDMGLLHAVAEDREDVVALAQRWAADLAALPRDALAGMKQLLYAPELRDEQDAERLERQLFNDLWGQPAHRQALASFLGQGSGDDLAGDAHAAEGDAGGGLPGEN